MTGKIFILQFRENEKAMLHERECFQEMFREDASAFHFVDAVREEIPDQVDDGTRAFVAGGSGDFFLSGDDRHAPWFDHTMNLFDDVSAKNIPTLGVCFGFQLLAMHQGADVVRDAEQAEFGGFDITAHDNAQHDPVFTGVPSQFRAQLAHKDSLGETPAHLVPLAKSDRVDVQAFRVPNKLMWGTLFHPELTKQRLIERVKMSLDFFSQDEQEKFEQVFQTLGEGKEAQRLGWQFLHATSGHKSTAAR